MNTPRILTASIAALITWPLAVHAIDYNWTANPGTADWNDPNNWDFNGVPFGGGGDNIFVHTPGSFNVAGVALDANQLFLAVGNAADPLSGYTFATGVYNLGTLFVGENHTGSALNNGYGRAFIEDGTTINVGSFHLGEWDGASGHVVQDGGAVNISNQFRLGHWPQASGASNSYDLNAGTFTVTGPAGNPMSEGAGGNVILGIDSSGTFTVNGGTFTGHGITMQTRGALGGESKLVVNGGLVNIGVNGIVTSQPTNLGTYDVQLAGGTIRATANWSSNLEIRLVSGGSGIVFDTNGRTISLSGNVIGDGGFTKIGNGSVKLSGANSFAGGFTVNNGRVQIGDGGPSGTAGTGPIVVNSPGDLSFDRSDSLTVSNAISGNGTVTIAGGAIRLANVSGSLNASVASGATLGTGGTLGTVFTSGGSSLEAGVGGVGDFNVGTMILSGATLKPSVGLQNTKFNVTTPFNLIATGTNTILINPTNLTAGTYTLVDYAGTIGGSGFSAFALAGLPIRAIGGLVHNLANTSIDLNISAIDNPKWTGAIDDNWDGTTQNWKLIVGGGPTSYLNQDTVLFDDTATGSGTVSLTSVFTPSSVIFNNSSLTYTFTGSGAISGPAGITKQNNGRAIIANTGTNDFTGPTLVQSGILQIGDGVAGSLGVDTSVTIAAPAAVELNLAPGATYATPTNGLGVIRTVGSNFFTIATNVLSGSPTLEVTGAGQTIGVNNQSDFGGAIVISDGTLRALGPLALGSVAGTTTITGNGTLDVNGLDLGLEEVFVSGAGVGGAGAIVNNGPGTVFNLRKVTLTADAAFGGNARWDMRSSGGGGELFDLAGYKLTKVGPNQVSLVGVNATDGDIDINGGVFSIEDFSEVQGSGTITLNFSGSLGLWVNKPGRLTRQIVAAGGGIVELGSGGATQVDSPISLQANLDFNVNGGGTVQTQLGAITESGGPFTVSKSGPGRLVLLGNNSWTGGYSVNNGVLQIGNGGTTGNVGTGIGTVFGTLVFARTDATSISDDINPGNAVGNILFVAGGEVTLGSGVDVFASVLEFGLNGGNDTVGGILNVGPGTSVTVANAARIGNSGGGGSLTVGTINQTGGTVDINAPDTDGRNFVLGHWGQSQGIYNLSAGTLNSPNISMAISWDGEGTFNLSGTGTANVFGLRFSHNPGRAGIFNLTGGTLNLGAQGIWQENAGFPTDVNLGGGIIRATATTAISTPIELTGTGGDVTFDTNGNILTINGALSGPGGLTKTGSGRLVLNAANSSTGTITVDAGTLALLGAHTNDRIPNGGVVVINNGATLEFSSTNVAAFGANYVVNAGGTLTNAGSVVDHVHIGSVQLNGGTWTTDPASISYDGENYFLHGGVSVGGTTPSLITQQGGTAADRGIAWNGSITFDVADVTGSAAPDLTVSTELEDDGAPGAALVKSGAGTMRLAFVNSYSGSTTVAAGTLELAVSQTLSSLIINDGATTVLGVPAAPPAPEEGLIAEAVQPVPEPGSAALILVGLAALMGRRRRG